MITLIFTLLLLGFVGKLISLSFKATWGILKFVFTIILFPGILIVLAISGFMVIALPLLIIGGIILLVRTIA